MTYDADRILAVLDRCCEEFTFPMLDNGYVYLASSRLSLHRSDTDWAMVIEIFGFSPRAGSPDIHVHTFASRLRDRDEPARYVSREAYERYLSANPNNDSRFCYPIDDDAWQDENNAEFVAEDASELSLRSAAVVLPSPAEYASHGIELEVPGRVQVFELCRFLADALRDQVLATPEERRVSVPSELAQILELEEWRHPDLLGDELPSSTEGFQQLAQVLVTGDSSIYKPDLEPNNHWRFWPEGGRL